MTARRLFAEPLEERALLSISPYVDNLSDWVDVNGGTLDVGDAVIWQQGTAEEVSGLTWGTDAFDSIQDAIDAASLGSTVSIGPGTFNEGFEVDKWVTVLGSGSGTDPMADTIIAKSGATAYPGNAVIQISGSGNSDVEPLSVQSLRVEPTGIYGIVVRDGDSVSDIALDNVFVSGTNPTNQTESEVGLWVENFADVDGLTVTDSSFDHLAYGWYFHKHGDIAGTTNVKNVTVENTSFSFNDAKGIYAEKLSDATFTDITVEGNGVYPGFWNGDYNAGVDINLKGGDYQNITFINPTITNNALSVKEGVGITVKARDDGSTYGANPATLDGVTILGGTITGNERGLRFGEPGKDNAGPTNVVVSGVDMYGNIQSYTGTDGSAYGDLINQSIAPVDAQGNWWGTTDPLAFGIYENAPSGTVDSSNPLDNSNQYLNIAVDDDWATTPDGTTVTYNGNDYVIGETAFDQIDEAIAQVTANGTIYVAGGDYDEMLTINRSMNIVGSSIDTPSLSDAGFNTGITITGATTVVNLENLAIDSWFYGVMVQDADVSVVNTSITNSGYDGIVVTTGGNVQVTDSLITGNRVGIEVGLAGAGDLSVEGTDLSGNTLRAVQVFPSSVAEIHDSNLSGYTGGQSVVNMNASAIIDASGNWWGTTDEAAALAMTTGATDITPMLVSGVDSNPGFGFGGDTSSLQVTTLGAQAGTEGRIQEAVDAVDAGGTVSVLAGTYPESVSITRSLTLQGPNAGTPGSEARVAEASITGTGNEETLLAISSDGVTVDGIKIDGDTSSAAYGILADGSYSNTIIENCVIQSVNGQIATGSGRNFGVYLRGDYSVSEGNVVANNLIDNVYASGGWSAGICVTGNYYTSITDNTINNVKTGISLDAFYAGTYAGAVAIPVTGNDINAIETGIEYSNIRQNSIPFDVSANEITGIATPVGEATPDVWVGIIGTNLHTGDSVIIEDNLIDGGDADANVMTMGYLGAANASTKYTNFTVLGGTVDNVDVGVGAVNFTPDDNSELEHDTGAADVVVDGVTINLNSSLVGSGQLSGLTVISSPTGVAAFDLLELIERTTGTPMKTGATALGIDTSLGMTITGGTTISGGQVGAMVDGADTSLTVDDTTFTSNTDILLSATSGVVSIGNDVSFNGSTFFIDNQSTQDLDLSSLSGVTFDAADNFRIEDKVYHTVDDASLGMVTWVAGNLFVTDAGTDHSIQRAISVASVNGTVNVEAGTYSEALSINVEGISVIGAGIDASVLTPAGLASNGAGVYISADDVTFSGFTVDGENSSVPRYGIKTGTVDGVTVSDIKATNIYRSAFDFLGSTDVTIQGIQAVDNGGVGLSLVDVKDAAISDITTSNNAWGGVTVSTCGAYSDGISYGIVISGANSFGEAASDNGALQIEQDFRPSSTTGLPTTNPQPLSFSTNLGDDADVTFLSGDFDYFLSGPQDDSPNVRYKFFETLNRAQSAAAGSPGHMEAYERYIRTTGEFAVANDFYVYDLANDSMTIQAAIDHAAAGDTINVAAGTYVENLNVDRGVTLVSTDGRDVTTIEGSQAGSVAAGAGNLGTICISTDGVHVGTASDGSDGFTILGYDVDTPGIEHAAVYYKTTANSDLSLIGNTITADGEAAILGEYSHPDTGLNISYNDIGGKTYVGNTVGGTSSVQYTVANVPRSLVYFGGNTTGIEFGNNTVTGSVGGLIEGTTDYYYNTGVTIDGKGATSASEGAYIHDNTFAVASWATLRARGAYDTIENNTYDFSQVDASDEQALGVYYENTDNDTVSGTRFLGDAGNNVATGSAFDVNETFVLNCDSSDVNYYTDGTGVFIVGPEGTDYIIGLDWLEYNNETIPVPTFGSIPLLTDNVFVDDDWADGSADPAIGDPVQVTYEGMTFYTIYGVNSFAAIQPAADAATDGNTVHVFAGTYVETITIDKSISLLGPNADFNPNTDAEPASLDQAVIMPDADDQWGVVLEVTGGDVTIQGLTFDGDNPALTSAEGNTRNGVDINSGEAIYTVADSVTITNNIVRNFGYAGIDAYSDGSVNNGNTISENLIQNIGCGLVYEPWGPTTYYWGIGIIVGDGLYADITDNVITDSIKGVQTNNYHSSTGITDDSLTASISGNTISATNLGIFYNLMNSGTDAFEISDNTITAADPTNTERPDGTKWSGILLSSLAGLTGDLTLSGNTITGPAAGDARTASGIEVWNCADTANITVDSTNTISSVNYGIFANNYEGYNSNAGSGAHVTIDGASITASDIGVYVLDSPNNTADPSAPVVVTVTGGTTITGAEIGVKVEGENTSTTINNVTFSGSDTDILLSETIGPVTIGDNVTFTGDNFYIDNRSALDLDLSGLSGTTFDETDNFRIEDKMYHAVDDSASGLITWVAGNLYVTQDSGSIQRAIDAASSGDTVNVEAGLYNETIDITKSLSLIGPQSAASRNDGTEWTSETTESWGSTEAIAAGEAVLRADAIDHVIDIADGIDVTVSGMVIEARNRTDSANAHLVYVAAKDLQLDTVHLDNNVIGPITGVGQDGTMGRFGIDFDSQSGSNNGAAGTISGNKIFGAEGNGAGLFVIGTHYSETDLSDYSGMTISDNDIYGSNRSGVELAGGITGLTITGNAIHDNGFIWDAVNDQYVVSPAAAATIAADADQLKYGDGINVVRTASTINAGMVIYNSTLTISGNTITDNAKHGLYMGPMVDDVTISGNTISENGDSGIVLDESAYYYATKPTAPAYGASGVITISGNTIADNTQSGIELLGQPTGVTISGTAISGSSVGIHMDDLDATAMANVTVTAGTTIAGTGTGILLEGEYASLTADGLTLDGFQRAIQVLDGSLTLADSTVSNSGYNGLYVETGVATSQAISLTNVDFLNNNTNGATNVDDVAFFLFNGSVTMDGVDITSSNTSGHAIQFRGAGDPSDPLTWGGVDATLADVTVDGSVAKNALLFQCYSDVSGVSLANVDLTGATTGWSDVALDALNTLNLGSTKLRTLDIWGVGGVDATGAEFYDLAYGTTLLTSGFDIEDQVLHAIDVTGLGAVVWDAGNWYLTPSSFVAGASAVVPTYVEAAQLQRAVAAAAAGDTVYIQEGTYTEGAQVVFDKNLTVIGEGMSGANATIMTPGFDTGSSGDTRGWWLVNAGVDVSLSNLAMDGNGNQVYQGIRSNGTTSVDYVAFSDIKFGTYGGFAYATMGAGQNSVTNSTFEDIGRVGVMFFGVGTEGVYDGNTYNGKGDIDCLDYALEIGGGATATAAGNAVTGNTGIASSDDSHSAAFMVTSYYGGTPSLTLTGGNTLTGNYAAIFVGYAAGDVSTLTISGVNNDLSGNAVGIDIVGATANISDADLSGNGIGITVSGGATVNVTGSDLTGYTGVGGNYAIENLNAVADGDPNVMAEGNDFGPYVDPTMIENVIYDDTDDATLTQVIYTNALNQQAAPAVVWVDDDWAGFTLGTNMGDLDGDSTDEIYGVDAFAVVQDAVNAVAVSGDVNIFDGDYDGEILITKDGITLAGETEAGVQILPTRGFADDNYGITIDGANGVVINHLTIDGDPTDTGVAAFKDAIHWSDNGGDNVSISNVTIETFDRRGISVWPENVIGTSIVDCTISNGTADNYGYAHAIKINGTGEVVGCTITNVTAGILSTCDVNGGTLVVTDNVISGLTGETYTPFDIGINIWCKASESPVVTIQRNTIIASVADNGGMYVVRPGDGSVISDNTITLSGEGGIGIETGWSYGWGVAIENNDISMGRGGTGILVTGSGDAADPMLISGNTITNTGADDAFTNDYYGYSEREVGILLSGDAYTSRTGDAHYSLVAEVTNNAVNGFKEGIAVIDLAEGDSLGGPADVTIFNNDLSGNGLALVDATVNGAVIDASGNWWGSNDAAAVAASVSGNVDYSPWLGDGTDIDAVTAGFQGDFSTLYVDDDSAKSDPSLGYIDEAIDLVTNSTIYVNPGIYAETVTIDKPVTLEGIADSVTGDLPVLDASGEEVAMSIFASDVSVSNLDIMGDGSTEMGINVDGPGAGPIENISITNSKLRDIGSLGTVAGVGIYLTDVDNVTITGITVGAMHSSAIQPGVFAAAGDTSSNVTISANIYDSAITAVNVAAYSPTVIVDESASTFNELPALGYVVDLTNVGDANFTLPQHAKVRGILGLGDATGYTPLIQTAVDYAVNGATINVTAGTFTEQVAIEGKELSIVGAGKGVTTIASPTTLAEAVEIPSKGDQYAVILAKGTDAVNLSDLTLDGANQGDTNYRFDGILYFDAGGTISDIEVINVMNSVFSGVQHGVGIYAYANEGTARTVTLQNSDIYDFQKNATAFVGADLTANVIGNTIVGAGVTDVTAQNGVQISGGASGLVQGNAISNISYDGNWSASGIIIMSDGDVTVENNTLTGVMTNILLDGIDEVLVQNNNITDGKYGVLYYSRGTGDNAKILSNTFTDLTYGVRSASSGTGTGLLEVEGNTFDSIDYGIVNFGDSFKVIDNDFVDNSMGLYLYAYCGSAATMVQGNAFSFVSTDAADSVGVYVTNGAVVDAGQMAGSTDDFTGLGISTGENDFTAFTSADSEGNGAAIYNGNADAVAGPQGTPLDVTAFGNTFSVSPEDVIYHDADDNALGFVDFDNLGGLAWSLSTSDIVENDTVTFSGSFTNDPQAHTLEIIWGDGTTQTVDIPQGTFTFSVDHTYLDDTGNEPSDTVTYAFSFELVDSSSASLTGSSDVDVTNVAPVIDSLTVGNADENGTVTLSGTYSDVGTQDTHELTINWADGSSETVTVTGGIFNIDHQYLDDNPTGTVADSYTISVTLTDDDTATASATTTTTITNLAPVIDTIAATSAYENGLVTLSGTYSDVGTQDTHKLTIEWADGSSETVVVTGGTFSVDHQYLDDDLSGTAADDYTITVSLADDDGGIADSSATTTITNVAPTIDTIGVTSADENGTVTLSGTYGDVGTLDTHELTIDWADGSSETVVVTGGTFSVDHQYLDDGVSGTASDDYTIDVTLTDDDGGTATDSATTTITNVAPLATITGAPAVSPEGTPITLGADITEPGTLDVLEYMWTVTKNGIAYPTQNNTGATFTFTPNDNAEYIVSLTVNDDDLGVGTDSVTITVDDVAPQLTLTGNSTTDEGQVYTLTLSDLLDPGNDNVMSYSINWGDGVVELYNDTVNNPPEGTYTHLYDDNATVTGPIAVTLVNEDGVFSNAATLDRTVNNVAPTGTPWNTTMDSGPVDEGSSATVMVYAPSDPSSADTAAGFSYAYDFDNDGTLDTLYTPGASTATVPGSYLADNPEQIVGISIRDKDGGTTLLTTTVAINNVTPTFEAGLDAEAFVDQSFTRTLTFTDPGNDALWTITADYGDGSPVETFTVSGHEFTLDHTYTTTGSYAVSVTVMDKDNASSSDSFNVDVFNDTFRVIDFTPTASGFEATFNRAPNLCVLNLYDGEDAAIDLADLVMVGSTTGEVRGSMNWDASTNTLSFVRTGSVLPTDTYTVTLRSDADAFVDGVSGALLDGDYSYSEGGDFVATFDVTEAYRVLGLPDLARGAGQDVNVPATNGGLPVTLSDANGVTSVDFHVEYDPAILDINGIVLSSLPSGWSFTVNDQIDGVFKVSLYSTSLTPLFGLDKVVAELDAVIPDDAPYATSQVIKLTHVRVNEDQLDATGDYAIHKATYLGDTDGDGMYVAYDASLISRVVVDIDNGFDAHDWTDPTIVGDVTGNGDLSGLDASYVLDKVVGIARPEIPAVPAGVTVIIDPSTVDPWLSIGTVEARVGKDVDVAVNIDIEDGADNVHAATFTVAYDYLNLSIDTAQIESTGLFDGWTILANEVTPGLITVAMYANNGPSGPVSGEIVSLPFTVNSTAVAGEYGLDLEKLNDTEGGFIWTEPGDGTIVVSDPATIVGRYAFMNNSYFDQNNSGADANDDAAIITNRSPMMPGVVNTQSPVTSSSSGLNGIMIDVADADAALADVDASDFTFRMSTDGATWVDAPAPESITVRPGEGVNGSDRVTIIWSYANSVKNAWLEVTTLVTDNTVLGEADAFYFGNLIADLNGDLHVNGSDVTILAANWQAGVVNHDATSSMGDINGDAMVNGSDVTGLAAYWQRSLPTIVSFPSQEAVVSQQSSPLMSQAVFTPPTDTEYGVATVKEQASASASVDAVFSDESWDEPMDQTDLTYVAKEIASSTKKDDSSLNDAAMAELEIDLYTDSE